MCSLENILNITNICIFLKFKVEGLLDDIDMKIQVTREQLEDLCKDLLLRIRNPVDMALKSSGLTMDVISQVCS